MPLQLLVSVNGPAEALQALEGGADLIDAKDPRVGALGPVSPEVLDEICTMVGRRRRVTAALGDAHDELEIAGHARALARAGVSFLKVGFAGIAEPGRVRDLLASAREGAAAGGNRTDVVAVAYADSDRTGALSPMAIARAAADAGAAGLLVDTADKDGPGLAALVAADTLSAWVAGIRASGLFVALAGKLTIDDIEFAASTGAEIVGVRGAACEGGRNGRVVTARVRELRARCQDQHPEALLRR